MGGVVMGKWGEAFVAKWVGYLWLKGVRHL